MNTREQILQHVAELMDDRPVRWAAPALFIGDFDGRERTLEVFNTDASEQRESLRRMRPIREELEAIAGGPVVVIFHTRGESARLHSGFVAAHEDAGPLRTLARRIREQLAGATAELERSGEGERLHLKVKLGARCAVIEWTRQTGFDVWLAVEPFVEREPDFRLSDGERAVLGVSMLLSDEPKDANLTDEFEQIVLPERGTANTNESVDAPSSLDFEDQVVGKGTQQLPRKVA